MNVLLLYMVSFWYGIVYLALSVLEIPSLFWLYRDQGVTTADLM